jgi:DNA-binding NarL/FixJ family response regulator
VIGVVIIADSGAGLQRISQVLNELPDVHIVRHCSGGAPVGATIAASAPDLVVLDELGWPRMTVRRITEITEHSAARVILSTSQLEASWLADALRAGASALVPRSANAATLRTVMAEVLATDALETSMDTTVKAA